MSSSATPFVKIGDVLLAHPLISDKTFSKSVILITDQNSDGITGLCLDKPSKLSLKNIFGEEWPNLPVYEGGPVDKDALFFIHKCPNIISESHHIKNEIYWCGDFESMKKGILNGTVDSTMIKFFIGYSGWSLDQIIEEIDEESWAVLRKLGSRDLCFEKNVYQKLKTYFPDSFRLWTHAPENIKMN
jgi:putative transcriptional regulator